MSFIHRLALTIIATTIVQVAMAEAPAGYYARLTGKADADLKTAACEVAKNFTRNGTYDKIYNDLRYTFRETDLYPNSNRWWDMYSDEPHFAPSFSGMNREHSFPKSWWGGHTNIPPYVDLNHLYPSEASINQAKSNHPLGEVDLNYPTATNGNNGVSLVGYPKTGTGGGAQYVFEPADEYKGDFARTYFYMVTIYQDLKWEARYMWMLGQNTYPTLSGWATDMLLRWHRADPVSQKEIDRNEAVYRMQNNRNPFIDMPELAEYIWGNKKGQAFNPSDAPQPGGDPELYSPAPGMSLDFGQIALGQSTTAQVYYKGSNLVQTLDVRLYSGDKAMFSIPANKIPTAAVNSDEGYWFTVTYTPTALGSHQSKLITSSGGLTGSLSVILRGECLPVPTLTACTATAPSDITADSYVANWTSPAGETVDYWVVTRTRYRGSEVSTEELVAETESLQIDDFGDSDREAYSVQSVRLGYRSPESNVVFVAHSGITGVEVDRPLIIYGYNGCLRFCLSDPQTGCRIYDMAGRTVATVDRIDHNMEVSLPAGIYLVTTDQHHTPVRVIVR